MRAHSRVSTIKATAPFFPASTSSPWPPPNLRKLNPNPKPCSPSPESKIYPNRRHQQHRQTRLSLPANWRTKEVGSLPSRITDRTTSGQTNEALRPVALAFREGPQALLAIKQLLRAIKSLLLPAFQSLGSATLRSKIYE